MPECFVTGVHGNPVVERRYKIWDELRSLRGRDTTAWLVLGDFNEITSNKEKFSSRFRLERNLGKQLRIAICETLVSQGIHSRGVMEENGRD